jgi:hypothetical protein
MSNGENRNGQDQEEPQPEAKRPPTHDDLKEVAEAAREAAFKAEDAAHNAGVAVDTMLAVMETGTPLTPPSLDPDDPEPFRDGEETEEDRAVASFQEEEGQEQDLRSGRPSQVGTGPAAQATGHGMMRGGARGAAKPAFEQFMAALRDPLRRAGSRVRVSQIAGWVKIEGQQGHKVYIAKTMTGVSRIESTLNPELVRGAKAPDPGRRRNGRIASWLPARPEAVAQAIDVLAKLDEPIPGPARGPSGRR